MFATMTLFQVGYYNYRKGFAEPEGWKGTENWLVTTIGRPGAKTWWVHAHPRFSPAFVEYVNGHVRSEA